MGMKTPCLGAHSGSLKKILVARTHNLGTPGARALVRQQPCNAFFATVNQVLFGENTGKQCVTMSLTAVIYHHLEDINFWTCSTLNNIFTIGNNLYMYISVRCSVQTKDYLLLSDIPCIVAISNKLYT